MRSEWRVVADFLMRLKHLLLALLSCTLPLSAQTLPAGTALPVAVSTSLNAKSSKPGQKIEGKLMQEVMLGTEARLKSGSHVLGHVVAVTRPGSSGARMTVQFDSLQDEHQNIPLHVGLRALATSQEVFQAGLPIDAQSTTESSDEWVTKQVGGEVVFRGRGYVSSDKGKIGIWSGSGVWGKLGESGDCSASDIPQQSLWIFSTTACGTYGFEHAKVGQSGLTAPFGQIVLTSEKDIDIRSGSGWLLEVVPASPNQQ